MRARWALAALLLASCGSAATNVTLTATVRPYRDAPAPTSTTTSTTSTTLPPETTTTTEAPTTTTEPPRPPVTAASRSAAPVRSGLNWEALRQCESGNNYATNTGNGYYGAYQFSAETWRGLGYGGLPSDAAPSTQDEAAQRLYDRSGPGQWPVCGRRL